MAQIIEITKHHWIKLLFRTGFKTIGNIPEYPVMHLHENLLSLCVQLRVPSGLHGLILQSFMRVSHCRPVYPS